MLYLDFSQVIEKSPKLAEKSMFLTTGMLIISLFCFSSFSPHFFLSL